MNADTILFFSLVFVAVAIAGATAFAIFWPLTLVHIRDRHPALQRQLGPGAFANPNAMLWLLRRHYRKAGDHNLDGLATPAFIAMASIIVGLVAASILWVIAGAMT